MYSEPENSTYVLQKNPGYVESLKRRAMKRELSNDLIRSLEDISAACILEEFENDDTLIIADRISKKLSKIHAKKVMDSRDASLPSKQIIKTYFSSFAEDPIINNINKQVNETDSDVRGFAQTEYLFKKHRYEEIIPVCSEEIECSGENKNKALVLYGTLCLLMGDFKTAFTSFDTVISDESADAKLRVNALIKRAALRMELQEPEASFKDFNEALLLDANNSDIFYHRGQVFLQLQNMKKARKDYEKSVSINPNFPYAYMQKCYAEYRIANIASDLEKMQEVYESFEVGLKKFPDSAEFFSLFAQVLCDRDEYEKAETYFSKALEIEPDNAEVHVHKGLLQLEWKDNTNQAIQCISEALKIDQCCEFAYETLGTIEVQRGNLKDAVEHFDKAIDLSRSESELEHLFSLRNIAVAQAKASEKLDILHVSDVED